MLLLFFLFLFHTHVCVRTYVSASGFFCFVCLFVCVCFFLGGGVGGWRKCSLVVCKAFQQGYDAHSFTSFSTKYVKETRQQESRRVIVVQFISYFQNILTLQNAFVLLQECSPQARGLVTTINSQHPLANQNSKRMSGEGRGEGCVFTRSLCRSYKYHHHCPPQHCRLSVFYLCL